MISAEDIEAMKPTRWIKVPRPGEFRGKGVWYDFDELARSEKASEEEANASWNFYQSSKYLPTVETHTKPEDDPYESPTLEIHPKFHSLD